MHKITLLFGVLLLAGMARGQGDSDIALIPQPVSGNQLPGQFVLPYNTVVEAKGQTVPVARRLGIKLEDGTGCDVAVKETV